MTQLCRYMNTPYTMYLFAGPTKSGNYTTLEFRHVCSFCGGAGQYTTSSESGRKVRR